MPNHTPSTAPVSVRVTLDQIYQKVEATEDNVNEIRAIIRTFSEHDNRIRKIELQMSGVLIINSITIAAITALVAKTIGLV